jgi:hypothetical protein
MITAGPTLSAALLARPNRPGAPNVASALFTATRTGTEAGQPTIQRFDAVADRSAIDKKVLADGRDRARAIAAALKGVRKELSAKASNPTLRGVNDTGEARARIQSRDIYGKRDVFETRATYEDRAVTEQRDVYETRDVTETRAVFGLREVLHATMTGTRDLTASALQGWANTGIVQNADFTVQVGSRSTATIRFQSNTRIKVTQDGVSTNFDFQSAGGAWRSGLVAALNSIGGLDARLNETGRLVLETEGTESLSLTNGRSSPLDELGLSPGTQLPLTLGLRNVQIGTETVIVGQQQVKTGTETVVVGSERVRTGEETVKTGTETAIVGQEEAIVGYDYVTSGAFRVYEDKAWVSRIDGDGVGAAFRRIDRLAGRKGLLAGEAGPNVAGGRVAGEDLSTARLGAARLGEIASAEQVTEAIRVVDEHIGRAEGLVGRLEQALATKSAEVSKSRSTSANHPLAALAEGVVEAAPATAAGATTLARQIAQKLRSSGPEGLGFLANSRSFFV